MRRVVAVLGAVLMVVVAVLVRGALDGDDDDQGGSASDGGRGVRLVCIDELAAVCEALVDAGAIDSFDAEPAGSTVDRLAVEDADLGADAWLTVLPFDGIATVARDEATLGPYFAEADALGWSTAIDLVAHPDRTDAAVDACDVTWPCAADLAGDRWSDHGGEPGWGEIKVGVDHPDTAGGLLSAAQAIAAHLQDETFATNDLEASDALRWFGRFEQGDDVLRRMVSQGAGAYSIVGALDHEARELAGSAQGEGLGIFYPAPMFRAEVALVPPAGADGDLPDADALDEALDAAGWEHEPGSTLPSPGALYALREQLS